MSILKTKYCLVDVILGTLQRFIALAVLAVLVSTLGASQAFATENFSVYENSDVGVTLEYPSDWKYDEVSDPTFGATFSAPFEDESDQYSENFSIALEPLGITLTPKEYADLSVQNMKGLVPNFTLISSEASTFAGKPAQKIIFEIPNLAGLEIKGLSIMTVDNTVGYSLSFFAEKSSFDSYLSMVNTSIDSFKISSISNEPVEIIRPLLSTYLTYDDPLKGFTIKYPPNWQETKLDSSQVDVVFQSPLESISDSFTENSLVIIQKVLGMSLEDYTKVSLDKFKTRLGLVGPIEDSPTTLAGFPAHQIRYTEAVQPGLESKAWMVWTIANDSVYVVAFASTPERFDAYQPIFQDMLNSVEIKQMDLPTSVSGTYSNSDFGLEMQLPDGWQGIEQQKDDLTLVMVSPGVTMQPFSQGSQMSDKLDFSAFSLVMGDYNKIVEQIGSTVSEQTDCSSDSAQIIELNSMKTLEMEANCKDPTVGTVKGLQYLFATKDGAVMAVYVAVSNNPDKTFEQNIEKFKDSLDTLKIQNTVDISNPSEFASTVDATASKESVTKNGKTIEVPFVSNSTITNVSFDEDNNQLSFEPKGKPNTSGTTGVYLGDVLEEPYSVTVGENQIDNFIVVHDTTNGQTSIDIEYKHPAGLITITNQIKATEIPDWVRGNAQWWAQGAIGDSDFVSGIQYLIKEEIMTIPDTAKGANSGGSKEIPSWIKNNADWWAQGLISDDDFVKGIQFLIENGILEV